MFSVMAVISTGLLFSGIRSAGLLASSDFRTIRSLSQRSPKVNKTVFDL